MRMILPIGTGRWSWAAPVEEDLCRLCYEAASYDALGRTGDLRDGRTGVLSFIAVCSSVRDDMLGGVPHAVVANMLELLRYAARNEPGELPFARLAPDA